jgi:RNA polymerase sigma factor (sigma-70 family)
MLSVMDDDIDRWFVREIIAHEAALTRYLARAWRDQTEVNDLRQDCYIRVYEAAAKSRPNFPKSFLFQTARHLMADHLRRRRVVSIESVEDLDALNVTIEEITPERRATAVQELRHLSDAFDRLPEKCRVVVWLRKVEGLSQREVAQRLKIGETTVEKHLARGVRALAAFLFDDEAVTKKAAASMQANAIESDSNEQ